MLFRHDGRPNTILLTERCDNYCLMCSQPPKTGDDDWLLDDARELIRLLPRHAHELGFTGGEPTFYGQGLIDLSTLCTTLLPDTDSTSSRTGAASAILVSPPPGQQSTTRT